ncbi:MAG: glycosyltransferase [Candidatus Omnitrophica bacterium]|nr:glycosyltransferase [Candidatus Omnitrophota bacterium]
MDESNFAFLEEYQPATSLSPDDYTEVIGRQKVEELKRLADPLRGKRWSHVNSTFMGGGVAEMLKSVIPLARSMGIEAEWMTIRGSDAFFNVTKKFHNMLQSQPMEITLDEIFEAYLDTIDQNAKSTFIASDLTVIHDPQPAALVMNGVIFGNVLWRCHIDTSSPNRIVWRFLLPYINHCAGAIFTMPQFVGPGIQIPTYQIMPCIDPLADKNRQIPQEEALEILSPLFTRDGIDPGRPVIAAISRYDIHKNQSTILKAFRKYRDEHHPDPKPYLIFMGNTATDDPEGGAMLETLKNQAQSDKDVIFWVNEENNDRVVGALMKLAQVFVHVSTREGFGLVVTEAMWQGTPVIGSRVGGIPAQVIDEKTGFTVDPLNVDELAWRMSYFMENAAGGKRLGRQAIEHVRSHFLLPELFRRHLGLLRFYTGVDKDLPAFRLDSMSYSEIMHSLRVRHPYLK